MQYQMEKLRTSCFLFFCIFIPVFSFSQLYIPSGNDVYHLLERNEIKTGDLSRTNLHTSLRPYTYESALTSLDSALGLSRIDSAEVAVFRNQAFFYTGEGKRTKPTLRYFYGQNGALFSEGQSTEGGWTLYPPLSALPVSMPNASALKLSVNPILYFSASSESGHISDQSFRQTLYINSRGAELQGIIDNKISFYTMVTDNQMVVPLHTKLYGARTYALPGEGYYKKFKGTAVDFLHAEGYVSAPISRHISMQFGSSRQFIGNGVRSLILSDFSKPRLFLKLNTQVWKFNYQNLFYEIVDSAYATSSGLYNKKFGSTHHLSINLGKRFNIGLFETVIFKRTNNAYELNYLNPVIFYRAVEHGLGSPDNVILGIDYKWNLWKKVQVYGQLVFDEFIVSSMRTQFFKRKDPEWGWWGNKYAAQVGTKLIDIFNIDNLDLQLEYNHVRPFTYGYSTPALNFTDFNQGLAHPMGANLKEVMLMVLFQPMPRLKIQMNAFHVSTGTDTAGINFGSDLLASSRQRPADYGNYTGQGLPTNIVYTELKATYRIAQQCYIDAGFTFRSRKTTVDTYNNQNQYFSLGLRINAAARNFMY
jgi:hypothetical protein